MYNGKFRLFMIFHNFEDNSIFFMTSSDGLNFSTYLTKKKKFSYQVHIEKLNFLDKLSKKLNFEMKFTTVN